jgi:hypothetical protein
MVLTEFLHLIEGEIKSGKVEPGVKEHGSVSSGKDEAVTVDPCGVLGVVVHLKQGEHVRNVSRREFNYRRLKHKYIPEIHKGQLRFRHNQGEDPCAQSGQRRWSP